MTREFAGATAKVQLGTHQKEDDATAEELATTKRRIREIQHLVIINMSFTVFENIGLACERSNKFGNFESLTLHLPRKTITTGQIAEVLKRFKHLKTLCIHIEQADLKKAINDLARANNCDELVIEIDDQVIVLDFARKMIRTSCPMSVESIEYKGSILRFDFPDELDGSMLTRVLLTQQTNYHEIHLITGNVDHLKVLSLPDIRAVRIIYRVESTVVGTFFRVGNYSSTNMRDVQLADYIYDETTSLEIFCDASKPPLKRLLNMKHLKYLNIAKNWIDGHTEQFNGTPEWLATIDTENTQRGFESLPLTSLQELDKYTHWPSLHTLHTYLCGADSLKQLRSLLDLPSLKNLTTSFVNMDIDVAAAVQHCNKFHAEWRFEVNGDGIVGKKVNTLPEWMIVNQSL